MPDAQVVEWIREKYHALVEGFVTDEEVLEIEKGVHLEEGETAPTPTPVAEEPAAALDTPVPHADATLPIDSRALTPEVIVPEPIPETQAPDVAKKL